MAKTNGNKTDAGSERGERLAKAAELLIETLGEETAAAIAGKCVVTYGSHAADQESARLAEAIITAIGVERYNAIQVF